MRLWSITTALLIGAAGFGASSSLGLCAEPPKITIDFKSNGIGVPPADFEFWRTGQGRVGQWAVVRDATAANGASIEQFSTDQTKDRFPLAIYKPISTKNLEVRAHFKLVSGTTQSAGVAVRVTSASNYYVVRASASEERVDLLRVTDGKMETVAGVDAEIVPDHWQTLEVVAEDDRFAISLDDNWILTAFDKAFMREGHVALWTQDDNVTKFEEIEITPLLR
jgi:predicted amino acid-binding ACT domain protein